MQIDLFLRHETIVLGWHSNYTDLPTLLVGEKLIP